MFDQPFGQHGGQFTVGVRSISPAQEPAPGQRCFSSCRRRVLDHPPRCRKDGWRPYPPVLSRGLLLTPRRLSSRTLVYRCTAWPGLIGQSALPLLSDPGRSPDSQMQSAPFVKSRCTQSAPLVRVQLWMPVQRRAACAHPAIKQESIEKSVVHCHCPVPVFCTA